MIPQTVYDLCHSEQTISSEYAKDPTQAPGHIIKKLYGENHHKPITEHKAKHGIDYSAEDIQKAYECGKWGTTRPSDLFLKIYHDVLLTLEGDPLIGMTSPPLLGSSGVLPLSIISPLPDICRHMSNVIARAEKEVFLATNYWQDSDASKLITNAFKELSRRAGERGQKIIVKVLYDRGNAKQFLDNHQHVGEKEYTGKNVRLPSPEEIPHIDLEVVNYHRPLLGTFHSKYMVVDRKIAILSSNNIQDNDNVEMMTHLEGPIVDSFYDMSLASWFTDLKPPLPCHNDSALNYQLPTATTEPQGLGGSIETGRQEVLPEHTTKDPHYDPDIASEIRRAQSVLTPRDGESRMQAYTRHLNTTIQPDTKGTAPECAPEDEMTTYIPHPVSHLIPMAMVCRKPFGAPNNSSVYVPQNEAFLSAIRNAQKSIFIQTPNLNAAALLPALLEAVRRKIQVTYYVCLGYNDSGELLPGQGGTNEMIAHKLYTSLTAEEKGYLHVYNYVAKDQIRPIHNKFKKRSCHIKLLIADDHIGIQGNGNQDTQSWYHSQEINCMIDSEEICLAWKEGIRRNQNTHIYGAVSKEDGCWHDPETGDQAEGAIGIDPGHFSWAKGIMGAVQRVRGAGGF